MGMCVCEREEYDPSVTFIYSQTIQSDELFQTLLTKTIKPKTAQRAEMPQPLVCLQEQVEQDG